MSKISELLKNAFDDNTSSLKCTKTYLTGLERKELQKAVQKAVLDAWDTAKEMLKPFDCEEDHSAVAKNKSSGDKYEWSTEEKCREYARKEAVNHPSHYQGKKFEVIDIIDDYQLNFNKGNALKYLLRAGHKDDYVQDLKKAIWYISREIETHSSSKGL